MIDNATVAKIRQKKFDSLAAKHLHVKRRARLNRWNQWVDYMALGVPIMYFVLRYLAKGTSWQGKVEVVWELLAGLLLALVLLKMAYHWQEKAERHSTLLGENISLVRHADGLLSGGDISPQSAQFFLILADKSEREDRDALGEPSAEDKRFVYREALKESGDTTVVCPVCNASPWTFMTGSCQACGNTPRSK